MLNYKYQESKQKLETNIFCFLKISMKTFSSNPAFSKAECRIKTKALFCKTFAIHVKSPCSSFIPISKALPSYSALDLQQSAPAAGCVQAAASIYIYFSLFSGHALAAIHPSLYCARVRLDIIDESQPRRLPQCTSPREGT
jgi:hypothetical protein